MTETLELCSDCGVTPGSLHAEGCDVERCAHCGCQRIACGCSESRYPRIPWLGFYPDYAECIEFGWYARFIPGRGWRRCGQHDKGASPDLNRLVEEATWLPEQARFVRK